MTADIDPSSLVRAAGQFEALPSHTQFLKFVFEGPCNGGRLSLYGYLVEKYGEENLPPPTDDSAEIRRISRGGVSSLDQSELDTSYVVGGSHDF